MPEARFYTKHNLNDRVRVRLRPVGYEVARRQKLHIDQDGFIEACLWEVMHMFGWLCFMSIDPPIETEFFIQTPK